MERQLVLEDDNGQVVRAYAWDGSPVKVIRRGDTRRLELVSDTTELDVKKIPFQFLGDLSKDFIEETPFQVGDLGRLKAVPKIENIATDAKSSGESSRIWHSIVGVVLFATLVLFGFMFTRAPQMESKEAELKEEVIKIVKKIPARQKVAETTINQNQPEPTKAQPKSVDRLKRMGALAALGSLQKSNQRGGLNLGAATTTAGPGLGGNAGSGGTQTSLYAKGLTSAPLGAGGRVEGAGGYGTKGKGGGQAGYGKMTLVGSTGAAAVGLSSEASVESGLDRDAIAAVVNKNSGQVRFCYEQGLQSDPNVNGRVAIDFTIGGNGMVKVASVANSSLNSKIIEDCIMMRLKSWKFPLPQGGVDVKVSYPFVLRRAGQG
ncbi:MAG: AgmX/PglI C-terminal domain-containing protein [Bdellovibrionales bacterium]|nr:AgmX/PglI C-terminal domain-containing protein [Bdellovibrionales bacterium]